MLAQPSFCWPVGAVFQRWMSSLMDVILHIGAHRTATTSFQLYMRDNSAALFQQGIGYWGPDQTRSGVFSGMYELRNGAQRDDQDDKHRIGDKLGEVERRGVTRLVISDENLIGSVRQNIREEALYPQVAERVAHAISILNGRVRGINLSVRSLEAYWCSALAYGVGRGAPVPSRSKLARIAGSERTWRDVIADISRVAPDVKITVSQFEQHCTRPDALFSNMGVGHVPHPNRRQRTNPAPDLPGLRRALAARGAGPDVLPFGMGRWNPFTNAEHAALREHYADDVMWLAAGASGMAGLTEDRLSERAGIKPPQEANCKGQIDEFEERHVARPG